MATAETTTAATTTTAWTRVPRTIALLTAVLTVLLIAFALPLQHLRPHRLPIAVAGPQAAVEAIDQRLQAAQPGAFHVDRLADADAATATARERIQHRQDYGAIVAAPSGPQVLTAGAAGPAVAQVLGKVAAGLQAPVTDVAPLPDKDPTGAGLAGGAMPLVMGGWICAVVILTTVRGTAQRLAGGFSFAAVGALSFIAVEKYWFGAVTGDYLLISAGVALGIAATAWTVLGLRSALGARGLALGAVVVLLLGYPLCGLTNAPELLPAPFGTLGQFLPPGATCTLLRSTAFFHGHGGARSVAVLAAWLTAGLALFLYGENRTRCQAPATAPAAPAAVPAAA